MATTPALAPPEIDVRTAPTGLMATIDDRNVRLHASSQQPARTLRSRKPYRLPDSPAVTRASPLVRSSSGRRPSLDEKVPAWLLLLE